MVMHKTGMEVNARKPSTGSMCANKWRCSFYKYRIKMELVRSFKLWDTLTEDNTRFLNSIFYNPRPF